MPEFSDDEIMLLTIYYDSKRAWLIGNLMNMLSVTTEDETELREKTELLIRKLSDLTNSQFDEVKAVLTGFLG